MYVTEWGKHCIIKLTPTGEYITRFGSKGSAPGQLYFPSSLTINNNLVYVSEYGNDRVSVFDTKGTFLYCFGKRGSGEGEFQSPHGITTDTFGNLYVSDSYNDRLVVYQCVFQCYDCFSWFSFCCSSSSVRLEDTFNRMLFIS